LLVIILIITIQYNNHTILYSISNSFIKLFIHLFCHKFRQCSTNQLLQPVNIFINIVFFKIVKISLHACTLLFPDIESLTRNICTIINGRKVRFNYECKQWKWLLYHNVCVCFKRVCACRRVCEWGENILWKVWHSPTEHVREMYCTLSDLLKGRGKESMVERKEQGWSIKEKKC